MKKIYISGPISGLPLETVYNNFTNAEVNLLENGYKVVNPFNNGLPTTATWEEHMRADLKLLLDCDAIYMLEGWEKSRGARIEYALAMDLKMDVQYRCKYSNGLNIDLAEYGNLLGLTLSDLLIRSRKFKFLFPRHVVMYHLKTIKGIGIVDIGRAFNCNHSSVLHAVRKIQDLIDVNDKEVLEMVDKIKAL